MGTVAFMTVVLHSVFQLHCDAACLPSVARGDDVTGYSRTVMRMHASLEALAEEKTHPYDGRAISLEISRVRSDVM